MKRFGMIWVIGLIVLSLPLSVTAHCDTLEGPVVLAARDALDSGDVGKVLIWVQPSDEGAVREAFAHAREVRALSPEAAALADRYFFETLVRLHRAGEGAPYTGLKEKMDVAEAHFIRAGDAAISTGDDMALRQHVLSMVDEGLSTRFAEVNARKNYATVAEGQEYVEAYVTYQHYVEGLITAAEGTGHDAHAQHDAESHADQSPPEHLAHESAHGWWKFWS